MTKTPEQIRLEAERRYPLYSDDITYYAANNIRQHQRQAFIAACHWLQSEQGEVICKCGHPANRHCIAECCHTGAKSEPRCLVCDCECFTPSPPQGEEGEDGFYTDRNGFKYKMSVQSDKTIFERMDGNRAGNYFVYHPKSPEISALTAELTALRSQLSEAQENGWDECWKEAQQHGIFYEADKQDMEEAKTTFINKIKN
jgi:hypothetical protein